jgi:hypothetical protein
MRFKFRHTFINRDSNMNLKISLISLRLLNGSRFAGVLVLHFPDGSLNVVLRLQRGCRVFRLLHFSVS